MKQKDVVFVAIVVGEYFLPQTKIVEWKENAQELGAQLEKLMKQQEELEPMQWVERIKYKQGQFEINKLQ